MYAPHAMAATSQPLATQIALDVMKQGGSVSEAAIAANAALGLMEPTGAGGGGDLFAIVWDAKTRRLYGLNSSGRSPKSLSYAMLKAEVDKLGAKKIPDFEPLPMTVPGAVDARFMLHQRFGKLPMVALVAPSIRYARKGHVQIVVNLIDFGMNLQEAGDAPRIYWTSDQELTGGTMADGGKVNLEGGYSETTLRALQVKRHTLGRSLWGYGGYQAIMREPGDAWAGASESRKDGHAAGY